VQKKGKSKKGAVLDFQRLPSNLLFHEEELFFCGPRCTALELSDTSKTKKTQKKIRSTQ
jgi:hypothetical protein